MRAAATVGIGAGLLLAASAHAQDVPGIEICTVEKTMERRTSCLQSNVNFLKSELTKAAAESGRRIDSANRRADDAVRKLEDVSHRLDALSETVAKLQKTVEALQKGPTGDVGAQFIAPDEQGNTTETAATAPAQQEAHNLYTRHWQELGGHLTPFASFYEQHGHEVVDMLLHKLTVDFAMPF